MSKYSALFRPNYCTHRERGDIPGCVPAVDVFIERSQEQVRHALMLSAERYSTQMKTLGFQAFINAPLERALPVFRNN